MSEQPIQRPRWGYQTGLWQPKQPAFWLFAALMLFSGWLVYLEQKAYLEFSASSFGLSWGLLLLYIIPVVLLVWFLDLYEREPPSLMVAAFLWGAVGAVALASLGNTGWAIVVYEVGGAQFAERWMPAIVAPPVEETLKVLGVVFIYLIARREIDDVMDGFVYGVLAGLGFAVVEDVFYFMGAFGGTTDGVLTGFFLRVVASGLYGHVLYTGLTGIGVAYFVSRRGTKTFGNRFGIAALLFLIAMLGHFVWNSPLLDFFPDYPWEGSDWLQIPLATAVKGMPLLAFGIVMIVLARRREHRWLQAALQTEVAHEGITVEELDVLDSPAQRRAARRHVRRQAGSQAGTVVKRLHKAQINLAMIRTRVDQDDHPDLVRQRQFCASLRDWLNRATAGASTAPPPGGTPPEPGAPPPGGTPPEPGAPPAGGPPPPAGS